MGLSNPPDASESIRVIILAPTPDEVLLLFSEALRFGAVADYQLVDNPADVIAVVRARSHDLVVGIWQTIASAAAIALLQESRELLHSLVFVNYGSTVLVAVTVTEHFTIAGDCDRLVMRLNQALRLLANKSSLPEEGLLETRPSRGRKAVPASRETTAAHDLNEQLTVIVGSIDVLMKKFAHDRLRVHYLDRILAAAKRAGLVAADLVQERESDLSPVDVGSTLARGRGLLRRVAGAGLSLSLRIDSEPMMAAVGRGWLESVICAVVAHARVSLPDGSFLEIALDRLQFELGATPYPSLSAGQYIRILFHYGLRGPLIQDSARTVVPSHATKTAASEMGLSSVYMLVSEVRGTLAVERASGGVSAVTIFLPLLYLVHHY